VTRALRSAAATGLIEQTVHDALIASTLGTLRPLLSMITAPSGGSGLGMNDN
jgi:hypothetical protein